MRCSYCSFEENGDIPNDRKELLEVDVGEILGIVVAASVGICLGNSMYLDVHGDCVDGVVETRPIKFCPMCGRKLLPDGGGTKC